MLKAFTRIFILIIISLFILIFSARYVSAINKKAGYYMYRCSDFINKDQAQESLDTGNPEYSKLDGDKDGVACENLK